MRSTAMNPEHGAFARHVATVATALALASVLSDAATAGSTPDPPQLVAMRDAVARAPVLLVRGDFGFREVRRAWLDSAGVSGRQDPAWRPRPALIASADAPRPEAPPTIPWSEITSLEIQRQKKLQGAIGGFVVGLAIGGTLALTYEAKDSNDMTGFGPLLGPPSSGLILGTIIGSLSGTKVIYRAPTQGSN
jgi:hypothetical protein